MKTTGAKGQPHGRPILTRGKSEKCLNANDGFTPETAKANPQAALTLLKEYGMAGGVMHVAPGSYRTPGLDSSNPSFLISTPISIIGDTGNPDDVLFEHGGASEFLVLDNAAALLSSVTLTNGYTSGQFASTGVKILAGGGMVTNCVIENCTASNGYQNRGMVYILFRLRIIGLRLGSIPDLLLVE